MFLVHVLVYLTMLCELRRLCVENGCDCQEVRKMFDKSVVAYFKILYMSFLGDTEEKYETLTLF
jgi:hypothetical protein